MKKYCLLLLSVFWGSFLLVGCNSRGTFQESRELEIAFASLAEDDSSYGVFMLRNTNSESIKIDTVKISNSELNEEVPSSLLKITSQSILPSSWEYGVFQVVKGENLQASSLRIEYELTGKRYFTSCPIKPSCVWAKDMYVSHDFPRYACTSLRKKQFHKKNLPKLTS